MLTQFLQSFGKELFGTSPDWQGGALSSATRRKPFRFVLGLVLVLLLAAGWIGCGDGAGPSKDDVFDSPSAKSSQGDSPSAGAGLAESQGAEPSEQAGPLERECWYTVSILGAKVGYQHTHIQPVRHEGRVVIRSESFSRLRVHRSGTPLSMEIRFSDLTTPEGSVLEVSSEMRQAGGSIRSQGRVQGDQLILSTTTQGKPQNFQIPWKPEYGGFHAVELSLARHPMKPGQTRVLEALVPVVQQVARIELRALEEENVSLPGGNFRLLKIESVTKIPGGQTFRDTFWVDPTGLPLKVHSEAMNAELVATTRQLAEDPTGLEKLDFTVDQAIPVHPRLVRPHQTTRVRYRLRLDRGNPAEVFPQTPYQEIRAVDSHTIELTVWASRPKVPPPKTGAANEPPTAYDRQPNSFIQSDHPQIVRLAQEAVGEEKNPVQQALRLERFVHGYLRNKNFSTAFASALEVLQSREGDCTEHGVLLAALSRAVGIPARVAIGLVYQEGKFYYHMWNEMYLEGRWIAFDSTLAEGGIGAAHIKLAHSHLHGASAFSAFLPVLNVLGQGPRIEVLDQQ